MSNLQSTPTVDVKGFTSEILAANVEWAKRLNQTFPQYFPDPRGRQTPKILWLGCSDSRVQESDTTTALPGTAFVHRNIANQFHLDDDNALSVLAYALKELAVQHVVVVGHDHCGGAITAMKAASRPKDHADQPKRHHILQDSLYHVVEMLQEGFLLSKHDEHDEASKDPNDAITRWLTPLVERVRGLNPNLPKDEEVALRIVVEENVRMQVENLTGPQIEAFVRRSARRRPIWVHGWVYDFSTGIIRDLQITQLIGADD